MINGKVYIGKHISNRYDSHYYGSGKILTQAIDKYGKENFKNEIIDTAEDEQELAGLEKKYIKLYKEKFGRGCYNIASGGEWRWV